MSELRGACILGQSGGPTAVINATAAGVIQEALKQDSITAVYGAAHGIQGVLNEEFYDMSKEDPYELELLKTTPSSMLGSVRYKLKDPDEDDTDYKNCWIYSGNITYATSSITAEMTPWIPVTKSANTCKKLVMNAG